ncbi:L,D-transpeptidase ['Paenibacillus yunnanensis' Narsing Rao et al. 2020]|uniref:L,D-transpeptidase n=1 Tax=Paenibacillus tengchongensis TaxID=2608684 RepID=UPI00124EB128|nr:L,D-transpeptidase [Paenibacillus tengchongensis]
MSYHIIVNLPANRDNKGSLKMYDGSGALVFGPVEALGRGTNMASNGYDHTNWIEENSDTPTGVYAASVIDPGTPTSSYGSYQRVAMDPTSGNALLAENNGRFGIMIHGGDASKETNASWYPLRPTYGCVRISNSNQNALINKIAAVGGSGKVTVNNIG